MRGLENESVDIAVFSLALWGPDSLAYIKEAHRILRKRGCIYIAEPIDAYDEDQRKELMDSIERIGFKKAGDIELRGKFFYLCAMKS